jgi:hypothetical protein
MKEVTRMTTHALPHAHRRFSRQLTATPAAEQALWLTAGGLLLTFLIPFVLADTLSSTGTSTTASTALP